MCEPNRDNTVRLGSIFSYDIKFFSTIQQHYNNSFCSKIRNFLLKNQNMNQHCTIKIFIQAILIKFFILLCNICMVQIPC